MNIDIQLTSRPITVDCGVAPEFSGAAGATVEFAGIVRDSENGQKISALEYEAYSPMAENQMRQILESLAEKHSCLAVRVIHRIDIIPVGETAIHVSLVSRHRGEAYALLAEFMNRLKQDVPIWKSRAIPVPEAKSAEPSKSPQKPLSMEAALTEIAAHCPPLPGVRASLGEAIGRTLMETVCARENFPADDRSTRDGYAILKTDSSEVFQVVDTLSAADWKPRELKTGEAVRVATGSTLPCENLRVVMQEDVERVGDQIKILEQETAANVRRRGEELHVGDPVLPAGTRLNPGCLSLLASVGQAHPLVSPRMRVVHFTTGDEIVPPEQTPGPGEIRDSNSILIRSLLQPWSCELRHQHLPENFELAKSRIGNLDLEKPDLVLVSGGASVGDKDFTRPLLEHLGFKIIFSRLNLRPGAPLIFGINGRRVAFGLPGNPLSHFVCYHLFVAAALARLAGAPAPQFANGTLAMKLDDAFDQRDTFWPARCELIKGRVQLTPLRWRSSGDMTCLASADALIRIPAQSADLPAGAAVEFLPV